MRTAEDPLARWDWMETAAALPLERTLSVSRSARFPAYEATDFGWGLSARMELAIMRCDGQVVVVDGRGGDGGVQASVPPSSNTEMSMMGMRTASRKQP
ncbi:hypothetical protein E2562_009087 [Oryza meyeriana var. granulata]|uniref:Uncharacterized protein n=1 Tax=Oryza meyeriana var. granulata TaxID=110450 RepID=A0A6G1D134_9ORYZ|nr:hypothetical protein E2562_009087 [Oryza meyeriana var. granulata]